MTFIACPKLKYQETIFNVRSWYHENIQQRSTLLITVGDSWTWGDSLGSIDSSKGIYDCSSRTKNIYGQLLANAIDADFINVAECGGSNLAVNSKLLLVLTKMVLEYKQIYIVWTMTEIVREIIDCPWRRNSATLYESGAIKTLDDFLELYERYTLKEIQIITKIYPKVKLLIARNFTNTFDNNFNMLSSNMAVEKTWVDILAQHQNLPKYPSNLRLLTSIAINPLAKFLKQEKIFDKFKADMIDKFALAADAMAWLEISELNYKKATKHPTEQGHRVWADYLLTYF